MKLNCEKFPSWTLKSHVYSSDHHKPISNALGEYSKAKKGGDEREPIVMCQVQEAWDLLLTLPGTHFVRRPLWASVTWCVNLLVRFLGPSNIRDQREQSKTHLELEKETLFQILDSISRGSCRRQVSEPWTELVWCGQEEKQLLWQSRKKQDEVCHCTFIS